MTFLADAQSPRRAAGWLINAGCDAVHTLDLPDGNRTTDQGLERGTGLEKLAVGAEGDAVEPVLEQAARDGPDRGSSVIVPAGGDLADRVVQGVGEIDVAVRAARDPDQAVARGRGPDGDRVFRDTRQQGPSFQEFNPRSRLALDCRCSRDPAAAPARPLGSKTANQRTTRHGMLPAAEVGEGAWHSHQPKDPHGSLFRSRVVRPWAQAQCRIQRVRAWVTRGTETAALLFDTTAVDVLGRNAVSPP